MTYSNQSSQAALLVQTLREKIAGSGVNDNGFYRTLRAAPLSVSTLKIVFQQYYYYIRTFPQILAGVSGRVSSELVRMKLARTVVSELGDGHGDPHFVMFEKVLASAGVKLDDWRIVKHIPEAEALVDGLRDLFLVQSPNCALGAHYVIEEIGLPMIENLYEGFRLYDGYTAEDYAYFYLHLILECAHVEWIRDAVLDAAVDDQACDELTSGADQVLRLLANFWNGLDRLAQQADYAVAAE